MIPLLMAEPGDKVIIQKVNGKEDLKRHLSLKSAIHIV